MVITLDNKTCPVAGTRTVGRCGRPTRYFMTYQFSGEHIGAMVCGTHERSLARKHLSDMAPWKSRDEIVRWDMDDWS